MSYWPSVNIVQAALRGITEVIRVRDNAFRGIRCLAPHVIAVPESDVVVCFACDKVQAFPAPPSGIGGPGEAPKPLFTLDTRAYAEWLLAKCLNPFAKEHEGCEDSGVEAENG